jgi:hypothetical protein
MRLSIAAYDTEKRKEKKERKTIIKKISALNKVSLKKNDRKQTHTILYTKI